MRLSILLQSLILIPFGVWAGTDNILFLNDNNFDTFVGKGKPPAFVNFGAAMCGHCMILAPLFHKLADSFIDSKSRISFAQVDVTGEGAGLKEKYGVRGWPTLMYFNGVDKEPETYDGPVENNVEINDLVRYIQRKTGLPSKIKLPPAPPVAVIDKDTFKDVVMDPEKDVLVAFTAPWCKYCQSMKPVLEKVAENFLVEKNCKVVNFDADAEHNKAIAKEYGVDSFPVIKLFPRASSPYSKRPLATDETNQKLFDKYGKHPIHFEKPRNDKEFTRFLNKYCGANRAVAGGLNEKAGRLTKWDKWAAEFMEPLLTAEKNAENKKGKKKSKGDKGDKVDDAAKARMVEIINEMKQELKTVKKDQQFSADWYLRTAEKISSRGLPWLRKETKRLKSILKKKSLAVEKLDEVKKKVNILNSFNTPRDENAEKAEKEKEKKEKGKKSKEEIGKSKKEEL